MGKKGITITLKSTSPEGEVKYFKSFPEAARELGFSKVGVSKACYVKRDRIGEYQLGWLEPELEPGEKDPEVLERIKRCKEKLDKPNCVYCNRELTRKDRVDECFSILYLGKDGNLKGMQNFTSLYQASKVTGLSLCSLINASEKGNFKITERKDKKGFLISWFIIHDDCFELRKAKRREEERIKDLEEWQKKLSKKEWFIKLQVVDFELFTGLGNNGI